METIAGRYRVIREVGRGGMGSVWLCLDERLGREVAVKQVGHLPGESVPHLARAMREARSAAPLSHPNVVGVHDVIEEGDHVWLVMEYVAGRTLSEIIAADGSVPPERAAVIGAQVADGLAAAHTRGTIHRDVKPGNILIGDDDQAKVSDFGIARTAGEETLTESGMVSGTPAYISPELARGGDPTPASDVWALGATLFAAVEGHPPYPSGANPLATLATIVNEPPPHPERAGVLSEPIRRMMDPDPGSRWGMGDVAHALHRIDAENRADRTREQTAASAAPAVAVAPDPAPEPTPEPTPAPSPAQPPPRSPGPRRRHAGRKVLLVLGIVAAMVIVAGVGMTLLGNDDGGLESDATDAATSEDPQAERDASPDDQDKGPTENSEPATPAPSDPPETSTPPPPATDSEAFVADYYTTLPEDTETGWSLLTPSFQREVGSFGDYEAFWATIDAVTVEDVTASGPGTVDATLVYTSDGTSQREVTRIELSQTDAGLLINGDQIVG